MSQSLDISTTANRIVAFILLFLMLGVFSLTLKDVRTYAGVDLRCKVVGARLLLARMDAYPDFLAPQPVERLRMLNDNTYTPALLLLYTPLSSLPFRTQRFLYFAFDWICVGGIFVISRSWFGPQAAVAHYLFSFLFLVADFGFRLHTERGQYYLLIALLVGLGIDAWRDHPTIWRGAVALAVLCLIRPSFLIVLPVLWIARLRHEVKGTVAVTLAGLVALLLVFGVHPWMGYLHTVSRMQTQYAQQIFTHVETPQVAGEYTKVEGQDFSRYLSSNYTAGRTTMSIANTVCLRRAMARAFGTARNFETFNTVLMLLVVICCLAVAYLLRYRAVDVKLAFAFLAPVLIESFGPQRYAYCDVTVVPILLLVSALTVLRNRTTIDRLGLLVVCATCLMSSVAAYVLSPSGRAIAIVSLLRWTVVLTFLVAYLLRTAVLKSDLKTDSPVPIAG